MPYRNMFNQFGSGSNLGFGQYGQPQNTWGQLGMFKNTGGFSGWAKPDPSIGLGQSPQGAGGAGGNMANALGGWGNIISGGIGSIFGGINAYQQAKAQNRQISKMTKGLDRQDRQLSSMEADAQSRGTGQAGNILNQYAMSIDPSKSQGYMGMYGQNLSGMHSTLGQLGQQRAEIGMQREALQGQRLDGSQIFMNTLGGALGGASQFQNLLGGFESNIFARNQRRSLQGQMDSNPNFWQDYFKR